LLGSAADSTIFWDLVKVDIDEYSVENEGSFGIRIQNNGMIHLENVHAIVIYSAVDKDTVQTFHPNNKNLITSNSCTHADPDLILRQDSNSNEKIDAIFTASFEYLNPNEECVFEFHDRLSGISISETTVTASDMPIFKNGKMQPSNVLVKTLIVIFAVMIILIFLTALLLLIRSWYLPEKSFFI